MSASGRERSPSRPRLDILPVAVRWQRLRPPGGVLHRDRVEIPDVHPDIDRVRASLPVAMHMAEQMQRTFAGVVPRHHRVVAERHRPVGRRILHLDHQRHAVPGQRLRQGAIMVADDQMPARSRELSEDRQQPAFILGLRAESEISDDPQVILGADLLPKPLDQHSVHVARVPERAMRVPDDVLVPEMRVGGIPMRHRERSLAGGAAIVPHQRGPGQ